MMNKRQVQLLVLLLLVVVGLALRFVLAWTSVLSLPPSTDEAISQLLADAISRGEKYPLLISGQPYQFPLEAYLMSVFSDSLPTDAFGTRIQQFVLRLITTLMLCVVAIKALGKGDRLPTLALILIPSAYWLLYQAGHFVPQHSIFAFISSLIFMIAIHLNRQMETSFLLTVIVGLLSGLLISNHLLALSVVVGAFLIVVFTGNMRLFFRRVPLFVAGLLLGLIPYFLAIYTIDGAYDAIVSRLDLGVFFQRFYHTVISYTLPGAMGINPPYFQDFSVHLEWGGDALRLAFVAGFLLILIPCILVRVYKFFAHSMAARWPRLEWPDMFLVITIASISMIAMNSTSVWDEHRYVLPAVWAFPFLIGYVYSWRHTLIRGVVTGLTTALVIVNLGTSVALIEDWRDPDEIQDYADIPELTPVINWMQENNIEHCYATFWQAYRVTYESNEGITCAPVFNERFIDWPVPYKDEVDRHTRVAYLLSHTHGTRYTSTKFVKAMKEIGITYQQEQFGKYYIFHDFAYPPAEGESILTTDAYELSTNIDRAQPRVLMDGDLTKAWAMGENQKASQYVEVALEQQQYVQRVDIVHPFVRPYPANSVRVLGKQDDAWIQLSGPVEFELDLFNFQNNHPILGEYLQTIRFEPQWLDAIRIELVSPKTDKLWTLSEIRVGVLDN